MTLRLGLYDVPLYVLETVTKNHHIYTRFSGKTNHIADAQVRKIQTKSSPVPLREISYLKINSFHSVFPCYLVSSSDGPYSLQRHHAEISLQ